jgi:MtfA peptidase
MKRLFDWLFPAKAQPIPAALWQQTLASLPFLACLSTAEQNELKILVDRFLQEKEFSTAGGLVLTDEICLSIAAQGCLPILKLGLSAYAGWVGIIIYPDEFVVPRHLQDEDGVVHEYEDVISGEAWEGGPLIISWHDAQMAGSGYNVVIHEFAHKLDMLNGEADGIPALPSKLAVDTWETVFFTAYDHFCQRVDGGEETRIDPYASEHPAEFFAVLSECFFEQAQVVHDEYPELYALMTDYYRQDPLLRLPRSTPT